MAKRFLASVANVELFERVNGELKHFASAHTLTDSSIGFQISMEDVRGGQGAKLFGRFGHTTGMTLQMTDAMFDINYLRLNLGAKRSESTITSVLASEVKTWDGSSDITLDNTAVSVGHLCGLEDVLCWAHKVDCKEGTSADIPLTVTGTPNKTIAAAQLTGKFVAGDVITISYFKNDPASVLYDVSATFIPGEVMAVMTANEYAGDSANVTTGEAVGQLVVKIPRLQLDGQFDLGLNMTSAATISLNGSALAAIDSATGKEYYAEILETNHSADFRSGLIGVAIDPASATTDDAPVVYGIYNDGTYRPIDNDKIAAQSVKSPSNDSGTFNGFVKKVSASSYKPTDLNAGKWASADTWYVVIVPSDVSDADYSALDIGVTPPDLDFEPKAGVHGILAADYQDIASA